MPRNITPHKEDIKAAIRKTGVTLKGLSLQNGLSPSAVAKGFEKPVPSANKAVADHLGRSLNSLWPEWYDANGNRRRSIRRKARSKSSSRKPGEFTQCEREVHV